MRDYHVRPCPACGERDVKLLNVFDFKFRVACLNCGLATKWHLHDPEAAVDEWNNQKGKENQ